MSSSIFFNHIFGDFPEAQKRIRDLVRLEGIFTTRVSTNGAGANSQVLCRCRIKLTTRDLILLWEIRDALPVTVRFFVEDLYEHRVRSQSPRCLAWETYREQLYILAQTSPWKRGRIRPRLLRILQEIRVFVAQQKPAKPKAYLRTPSAAGGRRKGSIPARVELDSNRLYEEEEHRKYVQEVDRELEKATRLLAAERIIGTEAVQAKEGERLLCDPPVAKTVYEAEPRHYEPKNCALNYWTNGTDAAPIERSECEFCPATFRKLCRTRLQLR